MYNFPYTNFHELNLDWILQQIKDGKIPSPDVSNELSALRTDVDKAAADIHNALPLAAMAYRDNILINSNFLDPVDQRGSSSITGAGYPIDRWYFLNGNARKMSSGILIIADAANASRLVQRTRAFRDGKYTLVFTVNGKQVHRIVNIADTAVSDIESVHSYFDGGSIIISYNTPLSCFEVGVSVNPGYSATVQNAAAYPGEYKDGFIPEYVPRRYLEELAECEHYLRVIPAGNLIFATNATNNRFVTDSISFPAMRDAITPTPIWTYFPVEQAGIPNAFGVVQSLRYLDASEVELVLYNRRFYLVTQSQDLAGCALEHLNLTLNAEIE